MNLFFSFLIWLILLKAASTFSDGLGVVGVIVAGIAFLIYFIRSTNARKAALRVTSINQEIPEELFAQKQLYGQEPFFVNAELAEALARTEAKAVTQKKFKTMLGWIVITPAVLALPFLAIRLDLLSFVLWCTAFALPVLVAQIRRSQLNQQFSRHSEQLRQERNSWLAAHPRPAQSRELIARYYPNSLEAETACILVELAEIDFLVYPQDSLSIVAGDRFFRLQEQLKIWKVNVLPATFGEATQVFSKRLYPCRDRVPAGLSPETQVESPPLSRELTHVHEEMQKGNCKVLDEKLFLREIKERPEMSDTLFCSYWSNPKKADIALRIRRLAIEQMGRDSTMMCYPNDPMPLMIFIADDSMESIEFLLAMEEEFTISVPDAEAEKIASLTFAEMVEMVYRKQRGHSEKN